MSTIVDARFDAPLVWTNLSADGSITSTYDVETAFLTVPVRTGKIPLVAGLFAFVYLTFHAVRNDGAKSAFYKHALVATVQGHASAGSMVLVQHRYIDGNDIYDPSGGGISVFAHLDQDFSVEMIGNSHLISNAPANAYLDANGDCEVRLYGNDNAHDWTYSNMSASYRIVGVV